MDIGTLVTRAAHRFGDRVAVEGPDATRTFAELGDRVTRIANGLLAQGLRPGDRVLDLQTNSTAYLETDLAIRAAGLVRAALNYRLHPSDWERIARDSGARGLVYAQQFADQITGFRHEIDVVVQVGGKRADGSAPAVTLDELIDGAGSSPLPALDPDALCGLHYSSGTTGHPKGAQRTHRNWLASVVEHDPGRARRGARPRRGLLRARGADHPHVRSVRAALPRRRRAADHLAELGP